MARKDPKGRVLRRGESYRPDKNLYIYQYRDPLGQTHTLYASNIVDLRKKEDEVTGIGLISFRPMLFPPSGLI